MTESNWAGTYDYGARVIHRPTSVEQVQQIVASVPSIRALGSRHSFNGIADSTELISLRAIDASIQVDTASRTVRVSAGAPYGLVARHLKEQGWALHNLGSLPHITVGGACSTGTHGSGNTNGVLATAVRELEFVGADGEPRTVALGDPDFSGSVVALGAVGILVALTLAIEPAYTITQSVYGGMPWETFLENVDAVTGAAYSVSVLGRWDTSDLDYVWLKSQNSITSPATDWFGSKLTATGSAIWSDSEAGNITPLGVVGSWADNLAHFRFDRQPSAAGDEIQSEYFVARSDAAEAIRAVRSLKAEIDPLLITTEFRTLSADELWLSPGYERDTVGIHFTWKRQLDAVERLLPRIESILAPFDARPHWGKYFTEPVRASALYPRLAEFLDLTRRVDPEGKFQNRFLRRNLT